MQVDVAEAARILGISHDAVRSRLRRGTLEGVKAGDTWRVILADDGQAHDGQETGGDGLPTAAVDDRLISQLRDENAYLRDQLAQALRTAERERERADVLQREALQRIEALTAVHSAPGATERHATGPARMESPAAGTTRQGGVWHRLRRLITG